MTKKRGVELKAPIHSESTLIQKALRDQLIFRPVPTGDSLGDKTQGLRLTQQTIEIAVDKAEFLALLNGLKTGVFTVSEIINIVDAVELPIDLRDQLRNTVQEAESVKSQDAFAKTLEEAHALDHLALLAVKLIARLHTSLLSAEPLTEIYFHFTHQAKAVLAIAWDALLKRGIFPLPPSGNQRIQALRNHPLGAMHFVSASDLDAGYHYTMGIALSAEAQALVTTDVSYGLDGELIVPGQAVSPIPPFLAMGTRLFAAGLATSSNISEEVQSIPMRNYPHPTSYTDLKPQRRGIYQPAELFDTLDKLISDVQQQLWKKSQAQKQSPQPSPTVAQEHQRFIRHSAADWSLPPIQAVFEVTFMTPATIRHYLQEMMKVKEIAEQRKAIALYLNIETTKHDRIARINEVVDVAAEFGFHYVAVADNDKDEWLPNLLEYLEPYELNAVADYSDKKGVVVIDGRPVDPIYTAATSAQRIQSVYTTLAVDILKMGMWLCLDALTARIVYRELESNPHIPQRMLLMPIGIVEPWNAFADNRDPNRTTRAILDPFEKIKFMLEEAAVLGIPSLLTDTRHKETWVLLGRKTAQDEAHPRENFIRDPTTQAIVCRSNQSAVPLLSWDEFMQCERLARKNGVLLGQAGSVDTFQLFRIISETTYDAAKEGKNPATAVWTAETERVLGSRTNVTGVELQSERSAIVSPFLAVINRGFESHAKLDGWLRYLAEQGQGSCAGLREVLQKQRSEVYARLQTVLTAQATWRKSNDSASLAAYQQAWEAFHSNYLAYHHRIKDNFLQTRQLVASQWAALAQIQKKSVELEEG